MKTLEVKWVADVESLFIFKISKEVQYEIRD